MTSLKKYLNELRHDRHQALVETGVANRRATSLEHERDDLQRQLMSVRAVLTASFKKRGVDFPSDKEWKDMRGNDLPAMKKAEEVPR